MNGKYIQLVATDLDGTFLQEDQTISAKNLEALHLLGEKCITRVAATGRNLRKVNEVIHQEVPFDFIVFSSGAGVYSWKERRHLFNQNLAPRSTERLARYFVNQKVSFYAFDPAPGNHRLWFHKGAQDCPEFNRFLSFHNAFARAFPGEGKLPGEACQFLLIIPEDENLFNRLKKEIESQCDEIRVIRSSSPVTKGYIWLEIFHREVSKGQGVQKVCNLLGIERRHTFGIGNDYNDLDLLHFTAHSCLTENAPPEIKKMFRVVPSNENNAFAYAIQPFIK